MCSSQTQVINRGPAAFDFTCALHTYFAVNDVSDASVVGLQGCRYLDSLDGRLEKVDDGKDVAFSQEVGEYLRAREIVLVQEIDYQ